MVEYNGIRLRIDLLPRNLDIFNEITRKSPIFFQGYIFDKGVRRLIIPNEETLVPVTVRESREKGRNEFVLEPSEKTGRLGFSLDEHLVREGARCPGIKSIPPSLGNLNGFFRIETGCSSSHNHLLKVYGALLPN